MASFIHESPTWKLNLAAATQAELVKITEDVAVDCRAGCPVDSGELMGSIHTDFEPGSGFVIVGTDHWAETEYGSQEHDITPRGPGYPLRFFWPKVAKTVFFMKVHHPGTPAQPFMRPSLWRRRAL